MNLQNYSTKFIYNIWVKTVFKNVIRSPIPYDKQTTDTDRQTFQRISFFSSSNVWNFHIFKAKQKLSWNLFFYVLRTLTTKSSTIKLHEVFSLCLWEISPNRIMYVLVLYSTISFEINRILYSIFNSTPIIWFRICKSLFANEWESHIYLFISLLSK